ncbi:MAG: 2-oxoacid ferredoxin oxidoreductase [Candidatus Lokiarchaeota archaeon]|nr:2-oxoacid ferredoxin oxidoreductase [Candidatus Lokiarchaeota archaeon]
MGNPFDYNTEEIAWCPGCGNFTLHKTLKEALTELGITPEETVFVSGIGQAAKLPQYMKGHMFNGLHGRPLAVAMAIKATNPELTVIVNSGDGCIYGEGGNHFNQQILRNPDITVITHNNQVYGLTKGQASPTSDKGMETPVQIYGVSNEPFNPIAAAVALDASFVSRVFVGDQEKTKDIFKAAIKNKGFSLVDAFSPCVSFNKLNTFKWYKENTYILDDSHDPTDRMQAFQKAIETKKYPLGIIYRNSSKRTFWEATMIYETNKSPLYKRKLNMDALKQFIESKKEL